MSANAIVFFLLFLLTLSFLAIFLTIANEKIKRLSKRISDDQELINSLKKDQKQRENSIELKEFLADLLAGEALVSICRVDPSNVFLYSPKDKK